MPKINFLPRCLHKIRGKLFLIIWGVISSGYMVENLVFTATHEWNLIHFEFCLYNVVTEKKVGKVSINFAAAKNGKVGSNFSAAKNGQVSSSSKKR